MPSPTPSRKRVHQQQMIRKTKSLELPEPKKRRISYLSNHLLIFQVNNKFRIQQKTPYDCFICALQYLEILDATNADMLRTLVTDRGVSIEQMLVILRVVLKDQYTKVEAERLPFESISQLFDLLTPSTATIVGFMSKGGDGHIVLLAKDNASRVGIIDPQANIMCTREDCDVYVKRYQNNPIYIFTHL